MAVIKPDEAQAVLLKCLGIELRNLGSRTQRSVRAKFCVHGEVTDADVAALAPAIRARVLRCLRRLGKLATHDDLAGRDDAESEGHDERAGEAIALET